jgi:nucleotidyltransferase/DNA polymerase involved in DNA repair
MNTSTADNAVQWLFLDLNAFFASCEQQEDPALRGKPIIVVQTLTDSACAIAASYPAKRLGISTGTLVREARRICADVIPVQARHRLYTDYHERILKAVDTCLPVEKILSIDEVACRLMGTERLVPVARELAAKVKRALCEQVGECLTCSIGLAPNVFLGKVASDIQKPDGLVVITRANLPGVLLELELQDIYGIGERMEQRLHRAGIFTVAELWQASPMRLRRVWSGINGLLFHQMLHGVDIQPPSPASPKAWAISMCSSRSCARMTAPGILPSTSSPRRPSGCGTATIIAAVSACTFHGSPISAAGGMTSASLRQTTPDFYWAASSTFGCRCRAISRCPSASCCSAWFLRADISRIYSQPAAQGTNSFRRWSIASTDATGVAPLALVSSRPRCAISKAMPLSGGCRRAGSFSGGMENQRAAGVVELAIETMRDCRTYVLEKRSSATGCGKHHHCSGRLTPTRHTKLPYRRAACTSS